MKPKDRDFIETFEGLMFCVVGYLHPPNRYTSYLKYIPDPTGRWSRGSERFSRVIDYYHVTQVEKTYEFLRRYYPMYLFNCPVRNITISTVPHSRVKRYYDPRTRLKSILDVGGQDPLERKLADFVEFLHSISGVDASLFGITGSILIGNHNPKFSDIDLNVYGREASLRLKESLIEQARTESKMKRLSEEKKKDWIAKRSKWLSITMEDMSMIAERRWNQGIFDETYFSIHPIRTDDEIRENYSELIYHQLGEVTGKAIIKDAREAMFLPSTYKLSNSEVNRGKNIKVNELSSYEGVFSDVFLEGEQIEFKGILEEVSGKQNFYRVVVGGAGSKNSYIRLLK
ncbi:hypothetical protein KEJ21_03525 [Candidatus Bathyarchaeota archaeon]|nr:hypothetical protein [Candidatus Bathyarchaeota archaeon]